MTKMQKKLYYSYISKNILCFYKVSISAFMEVIFSWEKQAIDNLIPDSDNSWVEYNTG